MTFLEYTLNTPDQGFVDITTLAQEAVGKSGVANGIVVIHCPHTTAGVTINENADPDVVRDLLLGLDKAFPNDASSRHAEGNSAAHLKASVIGSSVTALVEKGRLVLGTWQGVYFCEFDGPRPRRFCVKVMEG